MITTTVGILTASILGSVHCASMCGGFVCMYTDTAETAPARRPLHTHALYNGGRLVSYLLLGALAGALGARVTQFGAFIGMARAATVLAGALMIVWGTSVLLAQCGVRMGSTGAPRWWQHAIGRMLVSMRTQPAAVRAGMLGVLTTLLPCGWLYVFVAAAGGTGSVREGMLLMAVFWLGTVPALVAVGVGAQSLFGPFKRRLPTLSAVSIVLMGVLALSGRLALSVSTAHVH